MLPNLIFWKNTSVVASKILLKRHNAGQVSFGWCRCSRAFDLITQSLKVASITSIVSKRLRDQSIVIRIYSQLGEVLLQLNSVEIDVPMFGVIEREGTASVEID